jgi:hypothetical protein
MPWQNAGWVWNHMVNSHLTFFQISIIDLHGSSTGLVSHYQLVCANFMHEGFCKPHTNIGHPVQCFNAPIFAMKPLQRAPVHCTISGTLCFQKLTYTSHTYQMLFFVGNQPSKMCGG